MEHEGPPWLLVVVDGPSEIHDVRDGTDAGGVVRQIVRQGFGAFGDLAAQGLEFMPWKRFNRSPLRGEGERITDRVEIARRLARIGHTRAGWGTILLVDNDHKDRDWCAEFHAVISAERLRERTAIGVAREMIEAWLLADPALCPPEDLPRRPPDRLWGEKRTADSNHPKQVLRRLVLERRDWKFRDAVSAWDPTRARQHSPSLDAFMQEVEALAQRQGVH
jgi:hypothetical protein